MPRVKFFLRVWSGPFPFLRWRCPIWDYLEDFTGLSPLFRVVVQVACSAVILLLLAMRVPWFRVEGYTLLPVFWVPLAVFFGRVDDESLQLHVE